MPSQPLQRSVWKNLDHPASAGRPGHLGRAVDLRWTGRLLEEVQSLQLWEAGCTLWTPPRPHAVTLVLLRLDWGGEVRCTCQQARGGPRQPTRPVCGQLRPSLSFDSSEASELYVFQRIKPIKCLCSF